MAALEALEIPAKVPLTPDGPWTLLVSDACRTNKDGLRVSLVLYNGPIDGEPIHYETVTLGTAAAQRELIATLIDHTQLDEDTIRRAIPKLAIAVEDALRQQGESGGRGPSQATRMVELAKQAGAMLFHDPAGEAYATIQVAGHAETWPLKVKAFRHWLARQFYQAEGTAPGAQAVQDALGVLEGKAKFDGPEHPVYTRLAEHDGAIYLDLANEHWQAIEITSADWRIVDTPPVKFRRPRGMLPLPIPEREGTLDDLRPFLNLKQDDDNRDWILTCAWLLAAMRPTGPYPILVEHGEQGSAKSSQARILRALVDPNDAPLRSSPREERDLVIAATNGWVISLDNMSHLHPWLSDALCRLATGTGFATRELYSDAEEVIFKAQRPIVMNGIEELATRGDLLDRSILVYLPMIPEDERQDEKQFWASFEQARPKILGGLLTIITTALANLPQTTLAKKPRMADFALWAAACATADGCNWSAKAFTEAYESNRDAAHTVSLEASPVAQAVQQLLDTKSPWEGTATDLLAALEAQVSEKVTRQKTWPKIHRSLSNTLRRLAPTLRASGIDVTLPHGSRKHGRIITLAKRAPEPEGERKKDQDGGQEKDGEFASPPSPPSPGKENQGFAGGRKGDATPQGGRKPDTGGRKGDATPKPAPAHESKEGTQGDGGDAKIRTSSNGDQSAHWEKVL